MSSSNTNVDKAVGNGVRARAIVEQLVMHDSFQRILPASLFNLSVALQALQTEGVGGTLTITIPEKSTRPIEIGYASKSFV